VLNILKWRQLLPDAQLRAMTVKIKDANADVKF
jgi:hypothetical protein